MFDQYDDLLTLESFMEILAIGRNKAYELLRAGEIRSFKVGKAYRIPKICVQEYVLKTIHKNIEQYKQQFK